MTRRAALACFVAWSCAGAPSAGTLAPASPATRLLDCLEPIARTFHVRIVDKTGHAAPVTCVPLQALSSVEQAMDRLLSPNGLAWHRLDDGTLEVVAAPLSQHVKLPPLDIEGEPVTDIERPSNPLTTPLVERASASTVLDRRWLETAPLLGFNQLSWYAPNVYGIGQSLAIRGVERDTDYFPALTVTFDGIELGTRLLDDELVPLDDVTGLDLARGPRTFAYGEGAQAGAITLQTAAPAAEPSASTALGIGNFGAHDGQLAWSGPLTASGLAATVALDEHDLPSFVHQRAVPRAEVARRRNDFGRLKLSYTPESGLSAQLAALALSGDSSDRQIVPPNHPQGVPAPAPFDPYERISYASNPIQARTHARGAAGYVRYDHADRWALDVHASITRIARDSTELPRDVRWSDHELRRRFGLTLSEHPAPDWTVVAGLEHGSMTTSFDTPLSAGQLYFNYFATSTDSAAIWVEHAWSAAWNAGFGVRWAYERTALLPHEDHEYGYRVPIPLATIEWQPSTNQALTLSYGSGYRSGGQFDNRGTTYDPERSENLELSWRAQWFGGALHSVFSAFAGHIRDRYTYALSDAGDLIPGSVRDRGLEFELDAEASERWRVRAGVGVLDSRFSSFAYRRGDPTSEAPPQTATFGVRYGLAEGWYGAADAYHAGAARYYFPSGHLPAYDVLSIRVGYRKRRWEAALTAMNALDAKYIERVQTSAGSEFGLRLGDPRRIELRVKRDW